MATSSPFPQLTNPAQANAPVIVNEIMAALGPFACYAKSYLTTTGLTWGYYGGMWGGFEIDADTFTLDANDDNYLVVEIATGEHSADTATTDWDDPVNFVRVYKVTTGASSVTAIEDHRAGPGGVHGGTGTGSVVGGAIASDLSFTASSTTTDSDPGTGKLRWNNATQASATILYIDNADNDSTSLATLWAAIPSGSLISIADAGDADVWQIWKLTATPVNGTGYYKFTVSLLAQEGGNIANSTDIALRFDSSGAGAGVSVTTKGDLQGFSSVAARLPVGTNGQRLIPDSSQTLGVRWGSAKTTQRVAVTAGQTFYAFGDSFTTGSGASGASFYYVNRLATALGITLSNQGVAGIGTFAGTKLAFINLPQYQRRTQPVTWMLGYNDIYRNGGTTKTLSKIKGELRAFLANAFLESAVPGNDGSITLGGSWTTMDASLKDKASQGLGAFGKFSESSSATMQWTFTGDNLVIGCYNSDGVSLRVGSFTVVVDSQTLEVYNGDGLADGVSDGSYDNKLTHEARVYRGLGSGSHTVTITTTGAATGFPVYIDYLGTLARPNNIGPVLIAEPSLVNAAGLAHGGGLWTTAGLIAAGAAIGQVVDEFSDYPVALVRTNDWLDLATGISGDDEHPNNVGHAQIARAFEEAVLPWSSVTSVDASGGVEIAAGSAITATGVVRGAHAVNAQTGTSYAILTGDRGKLVTLSNASSIAVTLAQAGTTGFETKWFTFVRNLGNGVATITPTTSTIDGAATLVLRRGDSALIFSDGTNYQVILVRLTTRGTVALTYGATITPDLSLGDVFRTVLTGNVTVANPTNPTDGQNWQSKLIQDGTGSRIVTWGSKIKFPGGTAGVLSTAINAKDLLSCTYDLTDDVHYCVLSKDFA